MEQIQDVSFPEVVALKVHQWLDDWEEVMFDENAHRRRPDKYFYLFTLSAAKLRALSDIHPRTTKDGLARSQDLGIQRRHDSQRSEEIGEFIRYGYPWSDLSKIKRESGQFNDLRKPGWLPTAIVVNILKPNDRRRGAQKVHEDDLINVKDINDKISVLKFPLKFVSRDSKPKQLPPIEIIDGQHRLWAFNEDMLEKNYELPVVAFYGLDISWQAYLFWSINITPKRINASLAFDLYPLLRTEDWLERFEGHSVYRETRAQELVSALWSNQNSAWFQRINMLGEKGIKEPMASQAAWIRSLMATYVKSWEPRQRQIGGLFGAAIGSDEEVLPWSMAQQAAFLIVVGQLIKKAINNSTQPWAIQLRKLYPESSFGRGYDAAFDGPYTLLNTDQGIRGILYITNDLCYIRAKELELGEWIFDEDAAAIDEIAVNKAITSLKHKPVASFLNTIAASLAKYDWRTSSTPGLKESERVLKASFRGSGGYKELRLHLLKHLSQASGDVGGAAKQILAELR
jgi:hypothetical protein